MDFLRRHVEKLILGLALIALLVSIALLMGSLSKSRTQAADMVEEARQAVNGGGRIEPLDAGPPGAGVYDVLADPRTKFDTLPAESASPLRGSLYEPPDYVLCYKETCNKLIPYAADKCPFCGTEQPPKKDGGPSNSDRDGDGIPNHVEQKYPFLNPDYAQDALTDADQDGFLNVEEFKAKTDMQDPASIPPLGALLRLDKLVERPLPIMLKKINRNNSDDPAKWQITVQTLDATKKTWKSRLTTVGGKAVDGFTIRSAAFVDDPKQTGKQLGTIAVTTEGDPEPYTLTEGVQANERAKFARLYYLVSRLPQYARQGGVRLLVHKQGDTITLTRGREPKLISETYRLESLTESSAELIRTQPEPAQGEEPVRITVPLFNPRTDFASQATASMGMDGAMPGMMMGEPGGMMPGAPGMMPGVPGGRMP